MPKRALVSSSRGAVFTTTSEKAMVKNISDTPAGMVAVLLAARRSKDEQLEALARAELIQRWDIFVRFGKDFGRDFRKEHEQEEARKLLEASK